MQWLKTLFARRSTPAEAGREQQAKSALDALRRDEVSIGAQMRHGVPVKKAPGQVWSGNAGPADRILNNAPARPAAASQPQSDVDNFPLSMAVGAATGSAALGYLAGGSISGAYLGSTMSSDHSTLSSSNNSCSSISSDYGGSTSSCDSSSSSDNGSSSSSWD